MIRFSYSLRAGLATMALLSAVTLTACNTASTREDVCTMPEGYHLDTAFSQVRESLTKHRKQCAPYFDSYWQRLLVIAEGDPGQDNKRRFSDFLLGVSNEGIISERQARNLYNRYFNIKFVSLAGDYNICSQACPVRASVMADMAQELADKEQGLLKVSTDQQSFQRADRLLQETELVLEATCSSCNSQR